MDRDERFKHPLIERYAGREIAELFSPRSRHGVWRELWIALAQAQMELGLEITEEQLIELRDNKDNFNWERVRELETELRHDVMAHVRHFGEVAPTAKGIIHLGATSCFVTDNADLVLYRRGLRLAEQRLGRVVRALAGFAKEHRATACLGYTHFQAAQPVTVGKRACLWIQDLLMDLDELWRILGWLPCRGIKGTTGTQASFLALFDGDHHKVRQLEAKLCAQLEFARSVAVSGQTYSRKIDWTIHQALSGIAQTAAKFATDMRLLCHEGELEEPSEQKQVGSSAMPYKKNPMRCERIASLARYVIETAGSSAQTAANQWLERSLDDSAIRRIAIPESFLAVDAILMLMENVARGLVVYPLVIARHLEEQLPFLATEEILMAGVRAGGDRQELHERIRVHARAAARQVKEEGKRNPLLQLMAEDPAFAKVKDRLPELIDPARFIGRAPEQVDEFLAGEVEPRLQGMDQGAGGDDEVRV
ncbi:MAG: adenylosuccinate lyase [Planctomycetota bacterium]|jgi:adenylosuccinate lyase